MRFVCARPAAASANTNRQAKTAARRRMRTSRDTGAAMLASGSMPKKKNTRGGKAKGPKAGLQKGKAARRKVAVARRKTAAPKRRAAFDALLAPVKGATK